MNLLALPVHLAVRHIRKRDHNKGPYLGREVIVPREKNKPIQTRLYRPVGCTLPVLPVLFNVHGGSWLFGDCESVDLQSQYLANRLGCLVVNINYLRVDEKPFPYQQMQVSDAVEYFMSRPETFHLDPDRAVLMGYSAGGHISAGAALLLRDRGIHLRHQVLCYPFLNFVGFDFNSFTGKTGLMAKGINAYGWSVPFAKMDKDTLLLSPANADPEQLKGLAPAVIVTCGAGDPLKPQGEQYAEKLKAAGIPVAYKEYKEAIHGFLENNFPDTPESAETADEQRKLMIEAVEWIKEQKIFD
jgi:acetyl esterase